MENQTIATLPAEVAQIAENVSVEKRNEVQTVLNHVFNGVSKMREQLDSVTVADASDKVNMKLANTIRLGVRQVRLDAEKTFDKKREEVQQQMLSYKTEDSLWLKAKQTMQILTKEIEENARWKEETKQRFDAEQKELNIQQRMLRVHKVAPEMSRTEFENMSDESFEILLSGIEKQFNDRIEAEVKAEAERIAAIEAEKKRIEEQRIENERLKKEAEAKEKQLEAERKKAAEQAEKIRIENEKKIAEERKLAEERAAKLQAEADAKLKAEQEKARKEKEKADAERAKLEAELKAKKDAEEAEKKRIEAEEKAKVEAAKKLAKAGDKAQLKAWVDAFNINAMDIKSLKPESVEIYKEINSKFVSFTKWANDKIDAI